MLASATQPFSVRALKRKDVQGVTTGMWLILALALGSAAAQVGLIQVKMRLQLRWRQWMTRYLIGRWLSERRFYQLNIVGGEAANPEYRIADDVRLATEPLVDFSIGLTNALLAAVAYISILWVVAGAITIEGAGTIPGYMVIASIIYSTLTSLAMFFVGRPLIARVEAKNAGEARLRYELTRVRDSAENIALIGGDDDERANLEKTFGDLARRWVMVITQQGRMTWISNASTVLSPAVPLVLCAPKYLANEMSLGELMQVATAFTQVQIALNWLVDNAIRLAEWIASAQRVIVLTRALDELDMTIGAAHGSDNTVILGESLGDDIHLQDLSLMQHNGTLMIEGADVVVRRGEKVLVKGPSGTGKSTLIRALAGLWPWGSGRILRPRNATFAFMPQSPYIPLGTLRHALLYPASDLHISDEKLVEALQRCGLSHLASRLDEEDQWDRILSGGEKQRLAFARLLINPPDVIIMDEATAALDEESQGRMLEFFRGDLARATVISVAHRPGLEEYFDREIELVRVEAGHVTTQEHRYSSLGHLWRRLLPPASPKPVDVDQRIVRRH